MPILSCLNYNAAKTQIYYECRDLLSISNEIILIFGFLVKRYYRQHCKYECPYKTCHMCLTVGG